MVLLPKNDPLSPTFLVKGGEYMGCYALKYSRNKDII